MTTDPDAIALLARRAAQHDAQAFRSLFEATSGRLLAVAMRVLDDRGQAEDVLQEVYLALWNRAAAMPEACRAPLAWLTTLVRHRAIDIVRRRRPEVPLQWRDADGEERSVDIADEGPAPPEQLEALQEDARLAHCLGTIQEEPRQALMLAY